MNADGHAGKSETHILFLGKIHEVFGKELAPASKVKLIREMSRKRRYILTLPFSPCTNKQDSR